MRSCAESSHRPRALGTLGPDNLDPDTLGPNALGPDTLGPDTRRL